MLDEIRLISEIGWTRDVSIVDKLLEAHWCEQDDLICAYESMMIEDADCAVVFFQLPFLVRLQD
jgi:hypothetical protein